MSPTLLAAAVLLVLVGLWLVWMTATGALSV